MPVWESEDGEQLVIGGIEEMMEYTDQIEKVEMKDGKFEYRVNGKKMTLHRDVCDQIVLKKDGKEFKRVPEVLDCWMDSGSVPFAEHHYPFENKEAFEDAFPADFIVEYTGQIRAWFNVLFRMSVLLFDDIPYKNVVCTGVMFGNDGRKMSKSYQNYSDPKETLEAKGGEALRLYIMSTPIMAGGDISWSDELLDEQIKDVLIPLWNTYRYLSLYANIHSWSPKTTEYTSQNNLDKWIESYMKSVTMEYSKALESYNIPVSVKLIQPCIDNISQWWIRRSRDRFAKGDSDALQTLYATMVLFSKTFAPQMPFLTEEIYQNLVVNAGIKDSEESVHLEKYPEFEEKDINRELLEKMSLARQICSNGLQAREISKISLRQPLSKAYIAVDDEYIMSVVKEELNLKEVFFSKEIYEGEGIITVGENEFIVSLDTNMTDELKNEGIINDFLRKYRDLRKKNGLRMDDKVLVTFSFEDGDVKDVLSEYVLGNMDVLQAKDVKISESTQEGVGGFSIANTKVSVLFE